MSLFGFEYPWLLLLTPIAGLIGWWLLRRRRPALRYSDIRLFHGLPAANLARFAPAILRGLAIGCIVLAAANPRIPDERTPLPVDGIALLLVLDVSGSMNTPDFNAALVPPQTRLDAAKATFRQFINGGEVDGVKFSGRANDQIGLVTFAAVAETACPLTLNHPVLLTLLDGQQARSGIDAGTNLGDALGEGIVRLHQLEKNNDSRKRVLILLSDGEHNKTGDETLRPNQSAQLAAKLGIPIYTIDCGGDGSTGSPEERQQRLDGRFVMESVAEFTGGRAFVANDAAELRSAFQQIDRLETKPAAKFEYRRYYTLGIWFGLTAVAILATVTILERTWWRQIP
jgi:Ca-activated chloride channel homolog